MQHSVRLCTLIFVLVIPAKLWSDEPDATHEFPASIRIVESSPESVTNFTLQLIAERGVHLDAYAPKNVAWKHVAARLTIRDADGQIVDSRVTYPNGLKVETGFLGDLYVYRDSTDLRVAITDKTVKRPLWLTLEGAGYNHLQNACPGRIKLNAVRE